MRDASCTAHPIDEMEPEGERLTAYQECARKLLRALNLGLAKIIHANDSKRAAYEVAFAFGAAGAVDEHNMTTVAALFGVHRAAISKNVADFQQGAGLPPSIYQKEEAEPYRKARAKRLGQAPEEIA